MDVILILMKEMGGGYNGMSFIFGFMTNRQSVPNLLKGVHSYRQKMVGFSLERD
jgi:hypothetical protein